MSIETPTTMKKMRRKENGLTLTMIVMMKLAFPICPIQVPIPQAILTGTEQPSTTRQQDEYLDETQEWTAGASNDVGVLNKSIYVSADEGDYDNQAVYDDYNKTLQEIYYTPGAEAPNTDTGLYYNTNQQNTVSIERDSPGHMQIGHKNVNSRVVTDEGSRVIEEAYPDDGYATEIGTQHNATTHTYKVAQDEFMGQFDDIDEIAYATASQIPPQVVSPKINPIKLHTVIIHE